MDDPLQSIIEELRQERLPKSVAEITKRRIRSESQSVRRPSSLRWASAALSALIVVLAALSLTNPKETKPDATESQRHAQAFVDTIQSLNVVSEALVTAGQKSGAIFISEAIIPWADRLKSAKEKLNNAISI